MERYDFDCQKCGSNIGNAYYVEPQWYRCTQESQKYDTLEKIYPRFTFNLKGKVLSGEIPYEKAFQSIIAGVIQDVKLSQKGDSFFKPNATISTCYHDYINHVYQKGNSISYTLHIATRTVVWHKVGEEAQKAYYAKSKTTFHKIKGRGRGRLGYCFCESCASDLDFKCLVCGSKLKKVKAKDHPGGDGWGIRGVREPSPMS